MPEDDSPLPRPSDAPAQCPKPRVVYLDHVASLSGGELALLRLLKASADAIDPYVILAEHGPFADRLGAAGIPYEVLPLSETARTLRKHSVSLRSLTSQASADTLLYSFVLARRLRALDPALVHSNSLKSGVYGALATRLAGVPFVWHLRDRIDAAYLPAAGRQLIRLMARWCADAVVCNSESTRRSLGSHRRAVVIPSIAAETCSQTSRRHDSEFLTIGLVGRIAAWKGQDLFLRAFAEAFPTSAARAAIVGAPWFGAEEATFGANLSELAQSLGIKDRVEFRGHCEDIGAELQSLDVLVHASMVPEPFGQVIVEGMGAGLPVIAARAGGPAEIITDGLDGILYTMGDRTALAEAMVRVSQDPELRSRLGVEATRTVESYRPAVVVRGLLELYESVLAAAAPTNTHKSRRLPVSSRAQ